MSRSLSLTMRRAMNSQETGEVVVALLTIAHPSFVDVLRLSSDPTVRLGGTKLRYGTISRGNTYLFCPMGISMPDDIAERAPTARLMVENVSRELTTLIRQISSPGTATIEIILASSPNVVEIAYPEFDIRGALYNANTMTLEMSIDALTEEPFPGGTFNPSAFPGLF